MDTVFVFVGDLTQLYQLRLTCTFLTVGERPVFERIRLPEQNVTSREFIATVLLLLHGDIIHLDLQDIHSRPRIIHTIFQFDSRKNCIKKSRLISQLSASASRSIGVDRADYRETTPEAYERLTAEQ